MRFFALRAEGIWKSPSFLAACQMAVYTSSGRPPRGESQYVSDDDDDDEDEDVHHVGDGSRFRGRRFLLENNTA